MLIKLQESLSENVQTYLAAYFAKNNISQSFTMVIHDEIVHRLDLVFAEGPLEGEVISYINGRFQYEGKDLAVVSEESMNVDEKSSSFMLEDGFVLCTEALMRHDYAVFDPLTRSIHRSKWYLQNKFIPMMADCVSNGYLPHLALESGPGWWDYIESDYDMRLNLERGFYCNKLEMKEGYVIYFYNFAEPKALGDALYGAAVVNKATLSVQYYKLELNFDNEWFLCEHTHSRHKILGTSQSRDRGEFINWILNRM